MEAFAGSLSLINLQEKPLWWKLRMMTLWPICWWWREGNWAPTVPIPNGVMYTGLTSSSGGRRISPLCYP